MMSSLTSTAKEYEKVMPFQLPSESDWEEVTSTLRLSKSGKSHLLKLLEKIKAETDWQDLCLRNRLSRDEAVKKLKDVERAAKKLRAVLIENNKLLPAFLPERGLEDIGSLYTFSAITEAIGRDIRSKPPSKKIQQLLKAHKIKTPKYTKQEIKEEELQLKRSVGPAYAGKLLVHTLDKFIQPIDEWHEERRRLSKGGRTRDNSRRNLVLDLALNAEQIIGVKPSSDVKGKFFTLCELVFKICGVSGKNLKNLISEIVREI